MEGNTSEPSEPESRAVPLLSPSKIDPDQCGAETMAETAHLTDMPGSAVKRLQKEVFNSYAEMQ